MHLQLKTVFLYLSVRGKVKRELTAVFSKKEIIRIQFMTTRPLLVLRISLFNFLSSQKTHHMLF